MTVELDGANRARQPRLLARPRCPPDEPSSSFTMSPGRRRVADRRRARRAGRPDDVVRPGLPPGLALLHRPDRPDPGARNRSSSRAATRWPARSSTALLAGPVVRARRTWSAASSRPGSRSTCRSPSPTTASPRCRSWAATPMPTDAGRGPARRPARPDPAPRTRRSTGFRVTIDGEPVHPGRWHHHVHHGPGGGATTPPARAPRRCCSGCATGGWSRPAGARWTSRQARWAPRRSASARWASTLDGTRVAGVTAGGDAVQVTDVRTPDADLVEVVSGATDLAPPVWDDAERLWLLDRAAGGAQISVVDDDRPRTIEIEGISGRRASHVLVSRDGSRLVAVIDRGAARPDRGQPAALRRPRPCARRHPGPADRLGGPGAAVRSVDIGWASPTSIVVAHRLGGDLYQVRTLSVDGAPAGLTGVAVDRAAAPPRAGHVPAQHRSGVRRTRRGTDRADQRPARSQTSTSASTFLTYVGG